MNNHDRILRAALSRPWAIQPEKLDAITAFAEMRATGTHFFGAKGGDTKKVDGEGLPKSAFAYRPTDDHDDWKLPIKFSSEEKTKSHIRNAIARWSSTDMPDADEKDKARGRIKAAAKEHDITLSDDDLKSLAVSSKRTVVDPDGDGDDDSSIVAAINAAADSCDACSGLLATASKKYDPESLKAASEQCKRTLADIEDAVDGINEELGEADSGSSAATFHGRGRLKSAGRRTTAGSAGAVAVIPLCGMITHRASDFWWGGGASVDQFIRQFRSAVDDSSVAAIVLDVDSPGGTVDGVPEAADEVYRARGKKPIIAVANSLMASAAYWIGCSATELVVTPSANVGSIGVYGAHMDISKMMEDAGVKVTLVSAGAFKTEGNPYEPLSDTARTAMQEMVDDYYGMFIKAVARGRNTKVDDVRNGFGQGRVVTAQNAVKMGMADRVDTLDGVLAKYGVSRPTSPLRSDTSTPARSAANSTTDVPDDPDEAAGKTSCDCACDACKADDCKSCDISVCPDPNACGHAGAKKSKKKAAAHASNTNECECECKACDEDDHDNCDVSVCPTPAACGHADEEAKAEHEDLKRRLALAEL